MSRRVTEPNPSQSLSIEDGDGAEVLGPEAQTTDPVVLATDSQGNSLTLLEEYARRREGSVHPIEFILSFICAIASLAFAALIYLNTH